MRLFLLARLYRLIQPAVNEGNQGQQIQGILLCHAPGDFGGMGRRVTVHTKRSFH